MFYHKKRYYRCYFIKWKRLIERIPQIRENFGRNFVENVNFYLDNLERKQTIYIQDYELPIQNVPIQSTRKFQEKSVYFNPKS